MGLRALVESDPEQPGHARLILSGFEGGIGRLQYAVQRSDGAYLARYGWVPKRRFIEPDKVATLESSDLVVSIGPDVVEVARSGGSFVFFVRSDASTDLHQASLEWQGVAAPSSEVLEQYRQQRGERVAAPLPASVPKSSEPEEPGPEAVAQDATAEVRDEAQPQKQRWPMSPAVLAVASAGILLLGFSAWLVWRQSSETITQPMLVQLTEFVALENAWQAWEIAPKDRELRRRLLGLARSEPSGAVPGWEVRVPRLRFFASMPDGSRPSDCARAAPEPGKTCRSYTAEFSAGGPVAIYYRFTLHVDGDVEPGVYDYAVAWYGPGESPLRIGEERKDTGDDHLAFTDVLAPPSGRWLPGEYRLDAYVNGLKVTTGTFRIR